MQCADLDIVHRGDHHVQVEQAAAADRDPSAVRGQPNTGLEVGMRTDLEAAVEQHLQGVAVHGAAGERLPLGQLEVQAGDIPGPPRPVVPAPFLHPARGGGAVEVRGRHDEILMTRTIEEYTAAPIRLSPHDDAVRPGWATARI